MMRSVLAGLTAMALLIAACGDDDDAPDVTATAASTATVTPSIATRAQALCDGAETPRASVTVVAPEAIEISGMAASRRNDGVYWAHNDSGDTARVIAFSAGGQPLGTVDVGGAEAIDWEAMSIGPGPEDEIDYLYMGDIGDNAAARENIVVYRLPEPLLAGGTTTGPVAAETITLRYPDGAHDAETLLVDPISGDLVIVTKEIIAGNAGVYVAPSDMLVAGGGTMAKAGEIPKDTLATRRTLGDDAPALARAVGYVPTDGSVSPDGRIIVLRTYADVWVWPRFGESSLAEALTGTPCGGPSAYEDQGEAIAFIATGDGYATVSEGERPLLHHFDVE